MSEEKRERVTMYIETVSADGQREVREVQGDRGSVIGIKVDQKISSDGVFWFLTLTPPGPTTPNDLWSRINVDRVENSSGKNLAGRKKKREKK